jgi:hypothetical protein
MYEKIYYMIIGAIIDRLVKNVDFIEIFKKFIKFIKPKFIKKRQANKDFEKNKGIGLICCKICGRKNIKINYEDENEIDYKCSSCLTYFSLKKDEIKKMYMDKWK